MLQRTIDNVKVLKELEDHNKRVALLSHKLSIILNLDNHNLIKTAGMLHDIGKLYIPINILNKPGKLTEAEFEIMKKHPIYSYCYLKDKLESEELCNIVRLHHESYNGTGYPLGLSGDNIPLGSRIIKVCDVFDALTSERVYRKKLSVNKAIEIMIKEKELYDPFIFNTFLNNLDIILNEFWREIA